MKIVSTSQYVLASAYKDLEYELEFSPIKFDEIKKILGCQEFFSLFRYIDNKVLMVSKLYL